MVFGPRESSIVSFVRLSLYPPWVVFSACVCMLRGYASLRLGVVESRWWSGERQWDPRRSDTTKSNVDSSQLIS